jgi:hypothetical protein
MTRGDRRRPPRVIVRTMRRRGGPPSSSTAGPRHVPRPGPARTVHRLFTDLARPSLARPRPPPCPRGVGAVISDIRRQAISAPRGAQPGPARPGPARRGRQHQGWMDRRTERERETGQYDLEPRRAIRPPDRTTRAASSRASCARPLTIGTYPSDSHPAGTDPEHPSHFPSQVGPDDSGRVISPAAGWLERRCALPDGRCSPGARMRTDLSPHNAGRNAGPVPPCGPIRPPPLARSRKRAASLPQPVMPMKFDSLRLPRSSESRHGRPSGIGGRLSCAPLHTGISAKRFRAKKI